MNQKFDIMRFFLQYGYRNINSIKRDYNKFSEGGNLYDEDHSDDQQIYVASQDNTRVVKPIERLPIMSNYPTNRPEQAVQVMTTRETGEKVPYKKRELLGFLPGIGTYRNNCAATTTDCYGFREMSNDLFQKNHQNYGFQQITRTNYVPVLGDIIQQHKNTINNRPNHMLMVTDSNTVHHAPGKMFYSGIESTNFYKDILGRGLFTKGDTLYYTPFRRK